MMHLNALKIEFLFRLTAQLEIVSLILSNFSQSQPFKKYAIRKINFTVNHWSMYN